MNDNLMYEHKVRIEFDDMRDAVTHAEVYGGRISYQQTDDGVDIEWFSVKWTLSEVMLAVKKG